jgi:alpha-ribazole phosphatase
MLGGNALIIHVVRHTRPAVDAGLCYGQTDLALASNFEQEAEALRRKLLPHYDAVYSSPLQRCSRLAHTLQSDHHKTDARLMEYNFGDWELKPWSEFTDTETKAWMDDFVNQKAPHGENLVEMKARVDEFYENLLSCPYDTVAVVTHSGVQRILHAHILATPLSHIFKLQLDFGAVLEIRAEGSDGLQTIKHL